MAFFNIYDSLWGILGLVFWTIGYFYAFKKPEIFFPKGRKAKKKLKGRIAIYIIGLVGWVLISFSLAGPRKAQGFANNSIEVNDIFFVVDVSRSMLANDFKPNRLEASKEKILEFIKMRPTDRIGIIMFSEKAFTLLPLTTDLKLINQIVSEIKVGFLGGGTNIGDALGLAVGRAAQSVAKNKVIILLTDGVSNVGFMTPLQAAEEAKKQKVKVYTIGVGGKRDAKIPSGKGVFGRVRYQNIPGGSIDIKTLDEIAETTGGKSYVAQDDEALRNVLTDIERLEKTEVEVGSRIIYKELYYRYLFLGLIFLSLAELFRKIILREGR